MKYIVLTTDDFDRPVYGLTDDPEGLIAYRIKNSKDEKRARKTAKDAQVFLISPATINFDEVNKRSR